MDCSRIPAPDAWKEASLHRLQEYRKHVHSCTSCRRRIWQEAPELLLFKLGEEKLPPDFWIGFWDSLHSRLGTDVHLRESRIRILRWAAVLAMGMLVAFYSRHLPESPVQESGLQKLIYTEPAYPLVEDIQNPKAKVYIFQADGNEKIVMMIDPDMEL